MPDNCGPIYLQKYQLCFLNQPWKLVKSENATLFSGNKFNLLRFSNDNWFRRVEIYYIPTNIPAIQYSIFVLVWIFWKIPFNFQKLYFNEFKLNIANSLKQINKLSWCRDLYSPLPSRPHKLERTPPPSPDQDDPPPTPQFLYVPAVYKMTKVLEDERENG